MKVTTTQILDGIQKYIEHDVLGKIPDARKWLVGGYVALIMMPYRQNPDALMNHPLVKPLCEDGTVDIDSLHDVLMAQARQGSSYVNIPMVGNYTVDASDVDKLYGYIVS